MDTWFKAMCSRLAINPANDILWQQIKRQIKRQPEACCHWIFFEGFAQTASSIKYLLEQRGLEIFPQIMLFYRTLVEKTQLYGDTWVKAQELRPIQLYLEKWSLEIKDKLSPYNNTLLEKVLNQLRSITRAKAIPGPVDDLRLPFLPHEVAWNLSMYLTPASKLADFPQFSPVYFLPSELLPLAGDLENYHLSPVSENHLANLLHSTRKEAIKTCLLNFAQTFPLVTQAKWAYAIYLSLNQGPWVKHPFIRRLLANSYWEARLNGELMGVKTKG